MKSIIICFLIAIAASQRLTVDVYYESLCIGCQMFIRGSLAEALKTPDIEKIVHIRMIPYGNAAKSQDAQGQWTFNCQHGEVECYGNMIELCAQNRVSKAFPKQELPLAGVVNCLEKYLFYPYTKGRFDFAAKSCAATYKYDSADVISCASNLEGVLLHLIAANETEGLDPPHQWVPWAVGNKAFTVDSSNVIIKDLVGWACENYKGEDTIEACLNRQNNIQQ